MAIFPKRPGKKRTVKKNISKGLVGFVASDHRTVCSNHFEYGKPTYGSPNPTLYLVPTSHVNKKTITEKAKDAN